VTILTVDDIKAHCNIVGSDDDALLANYIAAAEEWAGDFIGKDLASYATDVPPAPVPEKAKQAVRQLVAYWYDQRESAVVGLTGGVSSTQVPFGVADLLRPLRNWGAAS